MKLAITCPHCKQRQVEGAQTLWYLYGLLLLASYGSRTEIGCRRCLRSKATTNLVLCSLAGWWCFPWGLGTPLVMIQNIAALVTCPDEGKLRQLLAQKGIDASELEVDERGRTSGQKALVDGVLFALREVIHADGRVDPREIEVAGSVAKIMLGELLDGEDVVARLSMEPHGAPPPIGEKAAMVVLASAAAVAAADGQVAESEVNVVHAIGARLHLPEHYASGLLANARPAKPRARDARAQSAAQVLGIPVDASPARALQARNALLLAAAAAAPGASEQDRRVIDVRIADVDRAYEQFVGAA